MSILRNGWVAVSNLRVKGHTAGCTVRLNVELGLQFEHLGLHLILNRSLHIREIQDMVKALTCII